MDRTNGNLHLHYHIRWGNAGLDWESFGSRAEAEAGTTAHASG